MIDSLAIAGLEPALVCERFFELTRIARPSKQEEAAREHVLRWQPSGSTAVDAAGKVVVSVLAGRRSGQGLASPRGAT
jgi:di/tripeptidase